MVLQTVLEPIILGCKPNQNASGSAVPRDDDLSLRRLSEILGQIILYLC